MDNTICEIGMGFYLFSNFPWFLNSPLNEVLTIESVCVSGSETAGHSEAHDVEKTEGGRREEPCP